MKLRNFDKQLEFGQAFEDRFAKWLISKGWHVIPKYLYAEEGAPLLLGTKSYAVPDLDVSKAGKRIWVECKRKKKMLQHPATGYPLNNHFCYKKVQEITGSKVFIIFWDEGLKENPYYGNWLKELDKHIYKTNWYFEGKKHITFKYPEAFIKIKL